MTCQAWNVSHRSLHRADHTAEHTHARNAPLILRIRVAVNWEKVGQALAQLGVVGGFARKVKQDESAEDLSTGEVISVSAACDRVVESGEPGVPPHL